MASGEGRLSVQFLFQDLDTPYSGDRELDNPEGRRTRQRVLVLQGDIGLSERFAARIVVPSRDVTARGEIDLDRSGLLDVEAWARYGLGPEIGRSGGVIGAGLAFPTGRESDPDSVEENIVFGAGDHSLLLSAEGFRRLRAGHTLFGLVRYRLPLGSDSNGYRFAEDFGWAGTWQWSPGGGPVGLSLGLSGQHFGQDRHEGAPVISRGGRLHYLDGGISVAAGGGLSIGGLVQRLVEKDVRGDQLLSPWNIVAGATFSWGEHKHD